jgi:ABC-type phosphate transport system substrate-binding protein
MFHQLIVLLPLVAVMVMTMLIPSSITLVTAVVTLRATGATFPQLAYVDAISAYKFSNPSVTISYVGTGSGAGKTAVIGNAMDFAGTDSVFSDAEYATTTNADIQLYPTLAGAACAIYNIDGKSVYLHATPITPCLIHFVHIHNML